jgi:16S rRNA (cytosine1402-N4)-methyltransferase
MESLYHEPVLLEESIAYLLANKDATLVRTYVDCTLGGGGYTKRLLELTPTEHKVVAIDRDVHAIEHCRTFLNNFEGRVIFAKQNFANIASILKANMIDKVSGVVMDLGLSSYQLNEEDGFSYQRDTPLDMRADKDQIMTAADVLNGYSEAELNRIFREYGELRYNRQIARDIVNTRKEKKLETTHDLVRLLKEKIPPRYLNKDLSKVFQAVRIEVNGELDNLKKVLNDTAEHLETGARLAVISYHSLEDRIVKNFLRSDPGLKILTKRPIEAGDDEIARNTRARSAKLRAAEKK